MDHSVGDEIKNRFDGKSGIIKEVDFVFGVYVVEIEGVNYIMTEEDF